MDKKEALICPNCGGEDIEVFGEMCFCCTCRSRFPRMEEPKAPTSMRIFVSYGHPEKADGILHDKMKLTEAAGETELDHDLLWCLLDAGITAKLGAP